MFPKSGAYCLEPRILVCSLPHLCINLLSQDPFCLIRPFKGVIISDLAVLIYLIWSFFTKNVFNLSFFISYNRIPPPSLVQLLICFLCMINFRAYMMCLMYFPSYCFSERWTFILCWEYVGSWGSRERFLAQIWYLLALMFEVHVSDQ